MQNLHNPPKNPQKFWYFWKISLLLGFYMSFSTQNSPENYLNSRRKDYFDLLNDISENRDLGYCAFVNHKALLVKGEVQEFKSHADALAYILRTFW